MSSCTRRSTIRGGSGEFKATVDGENLSGEPIGCRVREVDDPGRDVFGFAAPSERNLSCLILLDLVDPSPGYPRRSKCLTLGRTRGNGVYLHVLVGEFERPTLGEHFDGAF